MDQLSLSSLYTIFFGLNVSKLVFSLCLILILFLLKKGIHKLIQKHIKSNKQVYRWKRTTNTTIMILGLLILGLLWISNFGSFTAFIGLITAAIAFALKDIVSDLAGYLFVVIRKPFQLSDRIEIGSIKGDVLQIEWFQITLLEVGNWVNHDQSTGRLVHVPINHVLSQPIFNYSSGFDWIWNEICVLMTFESDWEKAKKIILAIINKQDKMMNQDLEKPLKKAMQKHLIEYANIKPTIYTNTTESGINLTVRYLCPTKKRRISEHNFWEDLLKTFGNKKSLELAYPTSRYIHSY